MEANVELILHNGTIRTQDDGYPMARAVAISGNRIISVGSDRDVLGLASKHTQVKDLDLQIPIFIFMNGH